MGSKGMASRLCRCMKAPIRALGKARDFYVRSVIGCAGKMQHGSMAGYPSFGKSYSFRSTSSTAREDDLQELIRAVSMSRSRAAAGLGAVPRSQSVAVGRIDEDAPCDHFVDDVRVGSNLLFPRSRSCAVGVKRPVVAFA